MINAFKARFRNEQFKPSWLSIFVNSNFLIRKGIYEGIKENASYMSGTMLDFGCGRKPYRDIFNVDRYIGLEVKDDIHQNEASLIDVYYDGKTIPFDDRYFDSVYSSEVLQHISDIEPIIAEIERVLKKGGYLLITVPFVWHESGQPIDGVRYTSFGIVNLLERHGLKIIHQKKMGNYFTTTIQTRNAYLYHVLFPGPALVKLILTAVFISPYNLLGVILSPILGRNQDLFSNMVVVAQKTESL